MREPELVPYVQDSVRAPEIWAQPVGAQVNDTEGPIARPFLKWAGGKQWLVTSAVYLFPSKFRGTYYEPFLGSGAMFFARPSKAVLCDLNEELITTYQAIRDDVEAIIGRLETYPHDKQFFERMRRLKPRTPETIAARFIYLNKTAFNGMYRVNLKGEFNVPFGRYKNPSICQPERLRAAARTLSQATLRCADFGTPLAGAVAGDFAYLDPPYVTGHNNNGFLKYNAPLFSWEDQKRLSQEATRLRERGVHVLISNADHAAVVALYPDFYYYRVHRRSLIGGRGSVRDRVSEALLSSYPLTNSRSERV